MCRLLIKDWERKTGLQMEEDTVKEIYQKDVNNYIMLETVLAYIKKNNKYLLLFRNKKKIDINKNKWIGVGGHIEKDESPKDALFREIKEETGYDVLEYKKVGIVNFNYDDIKETMHLFIVNKVKGKLINCNEGTLKYFSKEEMDTLPMWEGDKYFLDKVFKEESNVNITLIYKDNKLVSHF